MDDASGVMPRTVRLAQHIRRAVDAVGHWGAWLSLPVVIVTCIDVIARKLKYIDDAGNTHSLQLWMKANAPAGSFERGDLPERCNRQWFIKTFCGGSDPGGGNVLDHIAEVAWYDPINLIASVEGLCSQFFVPTTVEVKGASHQVIGLSETNTGVRSPKELRQFMRHGVAEALRLGQTPIPVF